MLSKDIDTNLKELAKTLENTKLELYENWIKPNEVKSIKKRLEMIKNKEISLYNIIHSLDNITWEGNARAARSYFILRETLYELKNGRAVKFNCDIFSLLNEILGKMNEQYINLSQIRDLSRHEPFISVWAASKANGIPIFSSKSKNLTENQKNLLTYAKFYDDIYQNSECPSEEIINDDDALDGWLIKQKRQRELDKNEKTIEGAIPDLHKNDREMFIMAGNKEQAEKINDLNSPQSKRIKEIRERTITQQGQTQEAQLPDIQREIQMQAVSQKGK